MVVGNGMIARRFVDFVDRDDVVIFASGVSNSKEIKPEPFARERKLVEETLQQTAGRLFVYFSTASVEDPTEQGSAYVTHKLALEQLIAGQATNYLLIRASNVVGGPGNPHTILNFFVDRIRQNESFTIWKQASRNLIDLDDVYRVVTYCIDTPTTWNQTILVANPYSVSPLVLVQAIEAHTGRQAQYQLVDKGVPFTLSVTGISDQLQLADSNWQPVHYVTHLLKKYYA
ncbi:NAD-dependent epimerase/dehydratase family protein [Spirosoma utsteinense]|uniref:Nucleoside-diphosphate-sugar epimerase n=1 Tax=Spirosoma utsteinense TaxID=2585773 RepID=A0ABR6W7R4_9BACT|nr:NAD-dependent epimerase/dehydratase family protein [Spirosoma utsteinense]MBC3786326.1 nucleoside-diphosphate-sugar epimerase [Spirosoma utsteinense]MBC3791952.1 nucleoside-diphosphate-sugar epimerase [Spirosoma utsteinense]